MKRFSMLKDFGDILFLCWRIISISWCSNLKKAHITMLNLKLKQVEKSRGERAEPSAEFISLRRERKYL